MAVDQQLAPGIGRMAGQVDLADKSGGDGSEPGLGIEPDIVGADDDIVDIDQ